MGCNAHNHPSTCNCGWGGDTGGGGWHRGSIGYRRLQVVDGFTWRFDRQPTYDSFVNPNASCPVCGASVYYYQSPFGGRVFFDQLGPPWPKHPCTDNRRLTYSRLSAHELVFGPANTPVSKTPPLNARDAWRPLVAEELARIGDFDRIQMPRYEHAPGKFMYVPAGWVGHAPAYWRWCATDPGTAEVSCFRLTTEGTLETKILTVPCWLNSDEEHEAWRSNPDAGLTSEALTSIGFALSFAWRLPNVDRWYLIFPGVDLDLARTYFERAARSGYWVAINNLGVMYRDGLGIEPDLAKAFELFQRAAQSLEITPLRHLSICYRDGIGCNPNPELYSFLEGLITVREEENKASVA